MTHPPGGEGVGSRLRSFVRGPRRTRREAPRPRAGSPPGTLSTVPDARPTRITVMAYGPDELVERELEDTAELQGLRGRWDTLWVNVDGLADLDVLRRLGEIFELHQLLLEDIVHVYQRPKVEEHGDDLFTVTRMVEPGEHFDTEQVSMFLTDGVLVTFQEHEGDMFDPVRERIRSGRPAMRSGGPSYLAYALLDIIIDGYFPVLEHYGEALESLEEEVFSEADETTVARIHEVKRGLLAVRRVVWPQREAMSALSRTSSPAVAEGTRVYLRDCYDHTVQLLDLVETYRELTSGLIDLYLSSISNRMNEIMKVLTIIATIFIPLSFVAGVYGMNFDPDASPWNMPELDWYLGYPFALGLMAAIAGGLLVFFRRRGWL